MVNAIKRIKSNAAIAMIVPWLISMPNLLKNDRPFPNRSLTVSPTLSHLSFNVIAIVLFYTLAIYLWLSKTDVEA